MKNSLNLVFAILIFAVLGCSCPRLIDLAKHGNSASTPPPSVSNSSATKATPTASPKSSGLTLTLDKYNQIKEGISRDEVERIIGGPGTQVSSNKGGGVTFSVYKWQDEDFNSIIITFRNDKVMTKVQVGLK
jgi:outer membrane protein assembly factor BamE (lipoprotein component of BamABCDE complex)